MGVVSGCCCKEVYIFPHITYPYFTCISSFLQCIPTSLFNLKMFFRSSLCYFCVIYQMLLNEHSRSFKNRDHVDLLI